MRALERNLSIRRSSSPLRFAPLGLLVAVALSLAAPECRRTPPRVEISPDEEAVPANRGQSPGPRPEDYGLSPAESSAVEAFLRRNPGMRMALDSDRAAPRDADGDMARLYGVYHPYFVRGDVNDDGILDFVLAFVERNGRGPRRFSVVVFAGRNHSDGGPEYEPGEFVERGVALSRGDLAVDRDAVLVTPDVSEDNVRRYRWNPAERTYVLVEDFDEDPGTPDVSET